ncbi:MAG TPA: SurA N-terminal domain-containing protein, partial [Planctomycetaceae bacterium]
MEQLAQTAGGPPADPTPKNRRRWLIAGGGTAAALVAGAALMQVFRGGEGVAAEAGRAEVSGKATVSAPAAKPRYLARVGDAVVTYDQVAEEAMARYGTEVLDQLINRTIIEIACRQRGITVTEAEVEQEITNIAQEFGLDRSNWLQMLQAERNITPVQYKRDVIWPMLALKKLAGADVEVTESDVQKAFQRDYGPKVKARMIMMDNPRRMNEVWQKANEARAAAGDDLAKAAAEFGRLAREHSMEPTSKALDGVIPPIRRHTGPENENVENAAFNLRPGEISGIVQLPMP